VRVSANPGWENLPIFTFTIIISGEYELFLT
jgi:hypothetical protein